MKTHDDVFASLVGQLPQVQAEKDQICRKQIRFWLKTYGYQRLLEVIDEEQYIAFAQAEIATHRTETQFKEC